jgi:hypothetical protein
MIRCFYHKTETVSFFLCYTYCTVEVTGILTNEGGGATTTEHHSTMCEGRSYYVHTHTHTHTQPNLIFNTCLEAPRPPTNHFNNAFTATQVAKWSVYEVEVMSTDGLPLTQFTAALI